MNIEQLRLILETVNAAGDGAKDLALIWFGLAFIDTLLAFGIGFTCIYVFWRIAQCLLQHFQVVKEFADEIGTWLPLSPREKNHCRRIIRLGLESERKNTNGSKEED